MDAVKIYEEAARKVGRGEINLMEFWKLIRPLRDVEAVVRCRDCKHHHYEKHFDKRIPYCDRINYGYGWHDDDFCSRGERKDGDDAERTV